MRQLMACPALPRGERLAWVGTVRKPGWEVLARFKRRHLFVEARRVAFKNLWEGRGVGFLTEVYAVWRAMAAPLKKARASIQILRARELQLCQQIHRLAELNHAASLREKDLRWAP